MHTSRHTSQIILSPMSIRGRKMTGREENRVGAAFHARPGRNSQPNQARVNHPYCLSVKGTTLSRPCRTNGESEKSLFALTSARLVGFASALLALILILGFFESEGSTETTVAVPTALFTSAVSYMTSRSPGFMARRFFSATGFETPSQMVSLSRCKSANEYSEGSVFRR